MKRGMAGGAHRGPVGHGRQRRTIRVVQAILVLVAGGLLVFAGYSMGRSSAISSDDLTPPRAPSGSQTLVLVILAVGALGAAFALQGGEVRMPTPKRLRELEDAGVVEPVNDVESQARQESSSINPEHTG